MSCCPVTAEPAFGEAAHIGTTKTFGQTTIYATGPDTAKSGTIAFPDVFGPNSGPIKADADAIGKLGYAVVVVDLTAGDYLHDEGTAMASFGEWFARNEYSGLLARTQDAIWYLKTEAKVTTIASYGYCWGSWVGATLNASTEPVVCGHVSCHPTWMIENMIKGEGAVEELASTLKVPQLLLFAGDDPAFLRENGSIHNILKARADIGALSNVIDLPDQNHGWVNRGDLSNEVTKDAVKKARDEAIMFIRAVNPHVKRLAQHADFVTIEPATWQSPIKASHCDYCPLSLG